MTRENYFAFKKALLDSGYVWNVTKKGDYITIEPNQNISFYSVNVLADICYEIGIGCDGDYSITHTNYGDFSYVRAEHFNTLVYYARYRIVS